MTSDFMKYSCYKIEKDISLWRKIEGSSINDVRKKKVEFLIPLLQAKPLKLRLSLLIVLSGHRNLRLRLSQISSKRNFEFVEVQKKKMTHSKRIIFCMYVSFVCV